MISQISPHVALCALISHAFAGGTPFWASVAAVALVCAAVGKIVAAWLVLFWHPRREQTEDSYSLHGRR